MRKLHINELTVMELERFRRTGGVFEVWGYYPRKDLSNTGRNWDEKLYELLTSLGFEETLAERDNKGRMCKRFKRIEYVPPNAPPVVSSVETSATRQDDGNVAVHFVITGNNRTFTNVFKVIRDDL